METPENKHIDESEVSETQPTTVVADRDLRDLWAGSKALPDSVRKALTNAKSANTQRAYKADWTAFFAWCEKRDLTAVPALPETVAEFLADEAAKFKITTVTRRAAAIATLHRLVEYESPCSSPLVKETLNGLKRMSAHVRKEKSPPLIAEAIREMIDSCDEDKNKPKGLRDKAILLVGFAGAFRRSELALIEVADISWVELGLEVVIPYSKTDQTGEGILKVVGFGKREQSCPVRSLRAWLDSAAIEEGWLFRPINRHGQIQERPLSERSVASIVKARAIQAGVDGALEAAGHSLRSGAATQAANQGATLAQILQLGGWRDPRTALGYVQNREAWENSAGEKMGL